MLLLSCAQPKSSESSRIFFATRVGRQDPMPAGEDAVLLTTVFYPLKRPSTSPPEEERPSADALRRQPSAASNTLFSLRAAERNGL